MTVLYTAALSIIGNLLTTVLISRRAYLNLDIHFTCTSCTCLCLGFPVLIHICIISLEVSYKLSTYSAPAGSSMYYYVAYAFYSACKNQPGIIVL